MSAPVSKVLWDAESFEWDMSGAYLIPTGGTSPGFDIATWDQPSNWRGRTGRQLRATNDTNGLVTKPNSNGNPICVDRVYFCLESFPSSGYFPIYTFRDAYSGGNYCVVRVRWDGYLEAGFVAASGFVAGTTALTSSVLAPHPIGLQAWYRLDLMLDTTSSTWRLQWMISNGPATYVMPDATWAGQSAGDQFWRHGLLCEFASSWQAATIVYDDWVIGDPGNDQYPIGPGRCQTIVPSAAGTHSMGTTPFQNDDGTAIDSTSVGRLTDLFASNAIAGHTTATFGAGHAVEFGNGTLSGSDYLEFLMQTYTLAGNEVCDGITVAEGDYWRVSQPQMFEVVRVFTDLGDAGDALPEGGGADGTVEMHRVGSGTFGANYATVINVPGGWTQSRLSNLKFRYGPNSGGSTTGYYGLAALGMQLHLGIDRDPPNQPVLPVHCWQRE